VKFNAACAPSRSRPRLSGAKVQADAEKLLEHLGESGIGALTEISNPDARAAVAEVFKHRYHPQGTDTPIVWTPDWFCAAHGMDFGSGRVPGVAPKRHTVWAILQHKETGIRVGVMATHMMPGGWRPSARQMPWVPLIRLRWRRHRTRYEHRRALLSARCAAVIGLGDINRPGVFVFDGDTRASAAGIPYIGVSGQAKPGVRTRWNQNADHRAAAAVITVTAPKGVRR